MKRISIVRSPDVNFTNVEGGISALRRITSIFQSTAEDIICCSQEFDVFECFIDKLVTELKPYGFIVQEVSVVKQISSEKPKTVAPKVVDNTLRDDLKALVKRATEEGRYQLAIEGLNLLKKNDLFV